MTKAAHDASNGVPASRRILWLGLFIAAAVLVWTGGWFYAADRIEAHLPAAFAGAREKGIEPHCANPEVRGFPFRIGLFCDEAGFDLQTGRLVANAGALRSAAQIYRPGHVVSELDGPLTVSGAHDLSARLDWQLLHASSVVSTDGLSRASIEGNKVTIDLDAPDLPEKLAASVENFNAHIRRNEADLDIAADARDFSSPLAPALRNFTLEATIPGAGVWLQDGRLPRDLRGRNIVLHTIDAELADGGRLSITGTASVGQDGLVSGDFRLRIEDQQAVLAAVAELAPDIAAQVSGIGSVLTALDIEPNDDAVTLPVKVRNGQAAIGMIPLGFIPPL